MLDRRFESRVCGGIRNLGHTEKVDSLLVGFPRNLYIRVASDPSLPVDASLQGGQTLKVVEDWWRAG